MVMSQRVTVGECAEVVELHAAARVSLLGGFELRLGGECVELPQTAQRLVAFLALSPRALTRVFVAGSLWTDSNEAQANSSLRSVLWRLRVRAPVIDATSTHLSLAPRVEVDVAGAGALVRRLLAEAGAPDADDVLALCEAGELLPDWYEDWLVIERERVRQRRLHALEAACRRLTAAGRYAEALEAGLAAVAVEPLRETGHAAVIDAHLAEGNLVEASRQYETLRDLLRQNLGTHPSPRVHGLLRAGQLALA
jgi:DNA-binding SARP family transcriptional activator